MKSIVTISATARPGNYTSHALRVVNDELTALGHAPRVFDARELTLAFPGAAPTDDARRLREAVASASGILIATPEYHGTFSAMAKLIIENLGFPSALAERPVALVGVAAGRIGAIKSLEHLRGVCSHVGAFVLPGSISIAGVRSAFDEEGNCVDDGARTALKGVAATLLAWLDNYVCPKKALEALVREDGGTWTTAV